MEPLNPTPPGGNLLLDTPVLIDVLRGERPPLAWLQGHGTGAAISVITWIEILVGCREGETTAKRIWLEGFGRLDLDQTVAGEAVICRQQRGLKVPDAIILATARCHGLVLASRNVRDFPSEHGLVICPYQLGCRPCSMTTRREAWRSRSVSECFTLRYVMMRGPSAPPP